MPLNRTLARRLLRTMLPWYLLLAVAATAIQLAIHYVSVDDTIARDLASLGRTVQPAMVEAVWELDPAQIGAVTRAIRRNAIVSGLQVVTETGSPLAADGSPATGGNTRTSPLAAPYRSQQFALDHMSPNDGAIRIGEMTLFADYGVLWQRMRHELLIVLINSILIGVGLWLIFSWSIRVYLVDGITRVAEAIADWREQLAGGSWNHLSYPHADELGALVSAFNDMVGTIAAHNSDLRDLNDRLAASQAELRATNEDLERRVAARTAEVQALFNSATVGIVELRADRIVRCNRRMDEMFGYDPGEQVGCSTGHWYADGVEEAPASVPDHDDTRMAERQVVAKDGRPFWVRMTARPIDAGQPDQVVLVVQDITVERAAREEMVRARTLAEDATRMKSEFLANMSHEIRTPMNAVLGMLFLALKTDLALPVRNYLTKAQGAAQALLGIINDILDFSKIEAGRLDIEAVEFGLDAVIEHVCDAISFQAENKGIEFLVRYDQTIPSTLIGDPLRLGQILLNLCGNAVKFTDQGEIELAFKAMSVEGTILVLQVVVRDSGIGMTAEQQQRLFEKFSQADQTVTRRFGGTGLGLAISKQLIEQMGGRIWIEDSQPGKGTTLCLTLPLAIAERSLAHRRELVEQVGPLLKGVRVLVVDDNEASREILAEMLRFFHLEVATAASGTEALATLEGASARPFDLVLMDWRMPGMTGTEATQRLHRSSAIAAKPKVVMVTAYGREEVIRLADQAGADGFLIKPISPSTLLDTLLSVLGRGRVLALPAEQSAPAPSPAVRLAGAHLLLVEDNDINREFAAEFLRSEGIDVDEGTTGQQAVDMVHRTAYDAVLMDIQMPVMGGLEAARQIRGMAGADPLDRFRTLPIIAMTALALPQDVERSRQAGMNDHVTKPIMPEKLLETLGRWVAVPPDRIRVATPRRPAGACPADLAALSSLDALEGIRRIGGNADAYRRQLKRFHDHYRQAAHSLRALVGEEDYLRAADFCHALKGVTGSIGATELFEAISAVDAGLKRHQSPTAADLDAVEARLNRVMTEIDGLDTDIAIPKTGTPMDTERTLDCLARLRHALEYDVGAVEALLGDLRAGLAPDFQPALREIAAKTDLFAIDEAVALIDALRTTLVSGTAP